MGYYNIWKQNQVSLGPVQHIPSLPEYECVDSEAHKLQYTSCRYQVMK